MEMHYDDYYTVACLLVCIGLVAGLAETTAALQVPIAVAFAQVFRRRILDGVGHADAVRLLDRGQLTAGGRGRECGERGRHLRTGDVVDADGQQRNAGALVAECKVNAFLRHRNRANLRVDDDLEIQNNNRTNVFRIPPAMTSLFIHDPTPNNIKGVQLFQLAAPSATLTSPIDFQLFKQTQLLLFYPVRVAHLSLPL